MPSKNSLATLVSPHPRSDALPMGDLSSLAFETAKKNITRLPVTKWERTRDSLFSVGVPPMRYLGDWPSHRTVATCLQPGRSLERFKCFALGGREILLLSRDMNGGTRSLTSSPGRSPAENWCEVLNLEVAGRPLPETAIAPKRMGLKSPASPELGGP